MLNFVEMHYESFSRVCKKKKIKLIINDDFEIAEEFTFDAVSYTHLTLPTSG